MCALYVRMIRRLGILGIENTMTTLLSSIQPVGQNTQVHDVLRRDSIVSPHEADLAKGKGEKKEQVRRTTGNLILTRKILNAKLRRLFSCYERSPSLLFAHQGSNCNSGHQVQMYRSSPSTQKQPSPRKIRRVFPLRPSFALPNTCALETLSASHVGSLSEEVRVYVCDRNIGYHLAALGAPFPLARRTLSLAFLVFPFCRQTGVNGSL